MRDYKLDKTKSWEDRYKELETFLTKEAKGVLAEAPLRPAMFIGGYKDNRDANQLMTLLIDQIHMLLLLTGKDSYDFQMKWGTGCTYYHRNVDSEKTCKENLITIKAMCDDFLKWIDV